MNEATRRLLGVLLRFIDGFKATDSIVVAATNRKQDLDAALLSRCDAIVTFDLPDGACRAAILQHYAAHLSGEVRCSRSCGSLATLPARFKLWLATSALTVMRLATPLVQSGWSERLGCDLQRVGTLVKSKC